MTDDQRAVMHAMRRAIVWDDQLAYVDMIAPRTPEYMRPTASGARPQPMGLARVRRTLRELADDGYVLDQGRGRWQFHLKGHEWLAENRRD